MDDPRQQGSLYCNDPLTRLKGCGPANEKKLIEAGINTIGELNSIDEIKKQQLRETG